MFVLIGLLLPCVLAGARDNTIGTDVLVYGDAYLNYAQRYNSLSSFMNFDYLGGEPLLRYLVCFSTLLWTVWILFYMEFACVLAI